MADTSTWMESAKMKKHLMLILLLGFALACTNRTERIERTRDSNGVEVVRNRLPLAGNKESAPPFDLFEEGSIDTRDASIAAAGLTDIGFFDVDSEGNIYFSVPGGETRPFSSLTARADSGSPSAGKGTVPARSRTSAISP